MNAIARPWSELPPDRPPRGIVRLSREDMSALGIGSGAVLSVSGDRVAYARAFPAAVPGPVGLDAIVVANAAPRGRLTVELRAAETVLARRVECQVLEGDAPARGSLAHFTVSEGDALPLGRGRQVRVVSCTPAGPATITPETIVAFKTGGGGAARETGFAGIGGLDSEIAQLREMIELPLRRPDLFTRLGVDPPRGVLLCGPSGTGKTLLARAVGQDCGATFFSLSGREWLGKHPDEAEASLRAVWERAAKDAPSVVFIDEIDALASRLGAVLWALLDGLDARARVFVMAATPAPDRLDPALRKRSGFDREIELFAPDRERRRAILAVHTRFMPLGVDVDLDALAATTSGFVGADLAAFAREAGMAAIRRQPTRDLTMTDEDFQAARREVSPSAPRDVEPDLRFDDIGGLDEVKSALLQAVSLPFAHAELCAELGVRPPRGLLLAGPPGVGKTMLARALAHEANVNFIALRGLWAETGEETIRRAFARARRAAPVVLFFDEIDALLPPRGAEGLRDRLMAALLDEIDGEGLRGVFLLGATRRLDAVDPALRRAGRFEAVLQVPPPDLAARAAVASRHASRLGLAPEAFERIARATEGRVGAEIAAICQRLGLAAVRRALDGDRTPASDADIDEAVSARPEGEPCIFSG